MDAIARTKPHMSQNTNVRALRPRWRGDARTPEEIRPLLRHEAALGFATGFGSALLLVIAYYFLWMAGS